MYFPSNFSVRDVSPVRNSVDELFVEGACNVFVVNVCVIFECYGVVVLLWLPPVCQTVHCVPVGACASPVIPWPFDVFPPDICPVCAHEGVDLFV